MKAVSPLVATAILLVVTVAGGVILYNYMMNTLSSPQEYAAASVVSAKMLVDDNKTILNVKIANIGTTDV
jgi:flagellin-like protein